MDNINYHAVFALGAGIGDILLMSPLLERLNRQNNVSKVLLIGYQSQEEVLSWTKMLGLADDYLLCEENLKSPMSLIRLIGNLRKKRLTQIIFPHTIQSFKLPFLTSITQKTPKLILGYQHPINSVGKLFKTNQVTFSKTIPIYQEYSRVSKTILNEFNYIENALQKRTPRLANKKLIGLHLSTQPSKESKTLNPGNWAPLLEMLEIEGYEFVLFGAQNEISHFQWKDKLVNIQDKFGTLNLHQLYENIAKCSFFISNDGGPMHIAGYLNIPTIAFFGPTNPIMYRPMCDEFYLISPECDCRHTVTKIGNTVCQNPDGPVCRQTVLNEGILSDIIQWMPNRPG